MKYKYLVIINPHAGNSNKNRVSAISRIMKDLDMDGYISVSDHKGHIYELALEAVQHGYQNIICMGGDGTINETASAIAGTNLKLGIIPLGSGNGLARHLEIPLNIMEAMKMIKNGNFTQIDTMRVNQYISVNISGIGFDAAVAKSFEKSKIRGKWGYINSILHEYSLYKENEIIVSAKCFDDDIKINSWICSICNSTQYGNNAIINPLSDISDGLIELISLPKIPLLKAPGIIYKLYQSKPISVKNYIRLQYSEFQIRTNHSLPLHIDGEYKENVKEVNISMGEKLNIFIP